MSSLAVMEDEQQDEAPAKSKRRFIAEWEAPATAISWRTPADKAKGLDAWRTAVGRQFASSARVLRVAWTLEGLFGSDGYAFPTDAYLDQKLGVPIIKIQAALQELERSQAIIRASVFVRGKAQRRIWPSSEIVRTVFPTVGSTPIPHEGSKHLPRGGEREYLVKAQRPKSRRRSDTLDAARRDAELRDARARERGELP